jgi:antitoxin MazE
LKQLRIEKDINLEVIENEAIVIRPVNQNPREGWEDSFKRMHDDGEDELLIGSINDKDSFEWEW